MAQIELPLWSSCLEKPDCREPPVRPDALRTMSHALAKTGNRTLAASVRSYYVSHQEAARFCVFCHIYNGVILLLTLFSFVVIFRTSDTEVQSQS